ncbi:MAG: hypothetical protein H6832_14650 [Planctomycetes bacterium]|nr:hypothetical protein [Planctomycetota bacterium]
MNVSTKLHARYVPSAPLLGLRIDFAQDHVFDQLVEGFSMRESPVDADRAVIETTWNADRIGLDVRQFTGQGRLSRLCILRGTSFDGAFESLSVLGLPEPSLYAPVLFIEAIAIDNTWESVLLDLCQSVDGHPELASLAVELRDSGDDLDHGLGRFQSSSLIAVSGVVPEDFNVDHAISRYLDAFVATLHGACVRTSRDEARAVRREFLAQMNEAWARDNAFVSLFGDAALDFVPQALFDPTIV